MIKIDATETDIPGRPLETVVRLAMYDGCTTTEAEAVGLVGDSTALALVALVRAYSVSNLNRPREQRIAALCDRLTALLED